jgi:hypothetical protein
MATPPHTRPSKDKDAAAVLKRMADCPAFFERLVLYPFFRTSRIHLSRRSVCREPHRANAKTCLLERWQAKPSYELGAFNSCGSTGPIFIVYRSELSTRPLAARFGARFEKSLCRCKKPIEPFANRCHVPF